MSPSAPLGFCPVAGCPERSNGPCDIHRKARNREKDLTQVRVKELHSNRWKVYSRQRLTLHPWCVGYPNGVHGAAKVLAECTDHIKAARLYPELFWEPTNHASLCLDCNRRKGIDEEGGFGRNSLTGGALQE